MITIPLSHRLLDASRPRQPHMRRFYSNFGAVALPYFGRGALRDVAA